MRLHYVSCMRNPPPYPVSSADHALRLLLLLKERGTLRVSDAAEELGISRSTAHRLLSVLRHRGFATQDSSRRYLPGPAFYVMARVGLLELRDKVRPHMEDLVAEIDETAHVIVVVGGRAHFIDSVESSQGMRIGSRIGVVMPAHVTSGGKALLAELPDAELASALALVEAERPGLDTDALRAELATVRAQGFGLNRNESGDGITAIGMCLRDAQGLAFASMSVSMPSSRSSRERVSSIGSALRRCIDRAEAGVRS